MRRTYGHRRRSTPPHLEFPLIPAACDNSGQSPHHTETMDTARTSSDPLRSTTWGRGRRQHVDLSGRVHGEVQARLTAKNEVHAPVTARGHGKQHPRLHVPIMVVAGLAIAGGIVLGLGRMNAGTGQKVRSDRLSASSPTTSAPQTTSTSLTTPSSASSASSSVVSTTSTTSPRSTSRSHRSGSPTTATTSGAPGAPGAGLTTPVGPPATSSPSTSSSPPPSSTTSSTTTTTTRPTTTTTTSPTTSTTSGG